ncbi:MAG: EamA family transporter [Thermoleophilia bacterium]|nr:EamA family transporter [Thermoleophilia bacterium]
MADVAYIPGEPGHERRPAAGYAMVIAAALLFALNGTVSKVVLQSGISSLELVQVRATGAFLGFALLLAVTRRESLRLGRRELPYLVVFGIAGVALVQWLYFVSIGRLPIGIALLIEYNAPVLIAIWAWAVFKEAIRRRIWAALVLAVLGLSIVVEVWSGVTLDGLGVAAALAAAVVYAVYVLMAERAVRRRDPASLTAYGFLFAGLFWAAVQPLWRFPAGRLDDDVSLLGHLERFSLPVWLLLAYVIVAGTMVTFLLVAAALRHISATRVGIVAMLEPVAASAVAFVWLGESFGTAQLVGGAIVLVAILLAQTAR